MEHFGFRGSLTLPVPALCKHYIILRHVFLRNFGDNARNCVKMHRVVHNKLFCSQQVL